MQTRKIKTFYRRNLPHIQPVGAAFFVTFRLKDSIPNAQIWKLKKSFDERIFQIQFSDTPMKQEKMYDERKRFFKKYDELLDQFSTGSTFLKTPAVAEIVANELHRFNEDLYDLIAFTIMPNHVHILIDTSIQVPSDFLGISFESLNFKPLDVIMKRIKGPSAIYSNRLLSRSGKFWQKESYDHYIRNQVEFVNVIHYILNNPVKANLALSWEEHPFTFLNPRFCDL